MDFIDSMISERLGDLSFFNTTTRLYKFEKLKKITKDAQLKNPGIKLINLGVGEPDRIANDKVIDVLCKESYKNENRFYADNGILEFQEAACRFMKNVYDIDNLKDIHDKNDKKRKELAKIGYEMRSEKIIEFTEWLDSIKIDPTIESLNDKCLEIREDTLEYIYRKTNLNNRDKKIIDKMLTSALKRLIREPIINLKQTKDKGKREEYIKLVEELFEL